MKNSLALILLGFVWSAGMAQPVTLALHLETGKVYRQKSTIQSIVVQDLYGKEMKMVSNLNTVVANKVLEEHADSYAMEVVYESLGMSMNVPQGISNYNSDKQGDKDPYSQVLADMTGKPFHCTMLKNGRITEVKDLEPIIDSAFARSTKMPQFLADLTKKQMVDAYGSDAFISTSGTAGWLLPDKPVKTGDKWTAESHFKTNLPLSVKTESTLSELQDEFAIITSNSSMDMADQENFVEINGILVKYNLKGTMTSEVKVDRNSGWIISANANLEAEGNVFMKGDENMPEGMTIPMKLTWQIQITQ